MNSVLHNFLNICSSRLGRRKIGFQESALGDVESGWQQQFEGLALGVGQVEVGALPDHEEDAGMVQDKVVELDGPKGHLALAILLQFTKVILEEAEPWALLGESLPHGEDEVAAGLQDSYKRRFLSAKRVFQI